MTTAHKGLTVQKVLDRAEPDITSDALRKVKFGQAMSQVKVVVTALGATATPDITSAAVKAAGVVTGITALAVGEMLPPIRMIRSLRVTASGTATSLGTYIVSDASGTAIIPPGGASAAVGVALLSDDGKTITFPNTVTAFTIIYEPLCDTQQLLETL